MKQALLKFYAFIRSITSPFVWRIFYKRKRYTKDIVDRFTDYSVLVIDEIGKQFATDNERFAIFEIINARYNEMKPTVLVSNMNMEDIEEFLGKATIDRIKENGGQAILFDWESYRQRREDDES